MSGDRMTDAEFLKELVERKALIVHCSRPGKGDEGIDALMFPQDLQKAIDLCANGSAELCCSVIWPEHTETFGAVGIILKPRSTGSIASICTTDGGTSIDRATGKRVGWGKPFSREMVIETFTMATSYNEWNVRDADVIGIFVHPTQKWEVPQIVPLDQVPGFHPEMSVLAADIPIVGSVVIDQSVIAHAFPALRIFSFDGSAIVQIDSTGCVPVHAADLYT